MMDIESLNLQNAGLGNCRSLGSNHYPSDRFPKVSIGITVEKCTKLGSGAINKDKIAMPAWERRYSYQENAVEENKEPGVSDDSKQNGKLTAKNQKASGKLSTRFIAHETPTTKTVHVFAERTSALDMEEGMLKNVTVVASKGDQPGKAEKAAAWLSTESLLHETPASQKVQPFANQTSVLESHDGVQEKTGTIACGKRLEKVASTEGAEEIVFTARQEMYMPHKVVDCDQPDKVTMHNNEALKMKLWEILGMVSESKQIMNLPNPVEKEAHKRNQFGMTSQSNQIMDLPTPGEKKPLNRNQRRELLKEHSIKTKQNSDTIQTDSESPNEVIKRPVTRSMTRKKASSRTFHKFSKGTRYGKIPLSSTSSESKLKLEERKIFTFDEGEAKAVSSGRYVTGYPSRDKRKRREQRKKRIELQRIQLPKQLSSRKILKSSGREQTVPSPNKATPRSQETGSSPYPQFQHDKDKLQKSNKVPNVNHHLQSEANKHLATQPISSSAETQENSGSLKRKRYSWEHVKSQVPNDVSLEKWVEHPSVEKTSIPLVYLQCPTFAVDANPSSSRCKLLDEDLCTPVATQRRIPSRTSSRSNILESHKQETDSLKLDTESADETREIHESENVMFPHVAEGKETEKQPFVSPSKIQDYKSFEASDFFTKGYRSSEEWFLHSGSLHKPSVGFHQMKGVHCLKDKRIRNSSLSSPSHIGTSRTGEATGAHEVLTHYPEDSLARAVCQLALVLERFKTKIRSQICKKSLEILSAAGEKVHMQLQHAESQIEADIGKLLSNGKSKEKCMESKFQEQQERLRFMHDKFKEEINQHLLGCRNTLEEMEAYKTELKGSLDTQKASHKKFLLQVEEAIEYQISDAETRVATLHKEANRKMNGLKHTLKEWMSGTIN